MAISTLRSHISDAIQFQAKHTNAYIAIGKTSPWVDEENPPEEVEDTTALQEVIGYKKVKNFSLARPLAPNETEETVSYPVVTYRNQKWALIPVSDAYTQKARWVYVEAEIQPDDFPTGEFRQVGLYTGLTPKTGVTKQNLLPTEVSNPGELRCFSNRERHNRTFSSYSIEQFMILM